MPENAVEVCLQVDGADVPVGQLWSRRRRGRQSQTFAYHPSYLARPGAYPIDPALPLDAQPHQTTTGRETFDAFSDAAPDRWGRRLIARAEHRRAARTGPDAALTILRDVRTAVSRWRTVAGAIGLRSGEIERMAPAFEHEQADRADALIAGI